MSNDWSLGISIAADLVEEIENTPAEEMSLFSEDRKCHPQQNLVLTYFQKAVDAGPQALAAFGAALTDVISSADGAILDSDYIRQWARHPPRQPPHLRLV